ncbi:MAG: hypothetical protein K2H49_00365 [Muribaculaceae bacterium]|nr:hypothetical protein [Muribaculaceae bacterium]
MVLNSLQLEKLSGKIGQDVTTAAGASVLCLDIELKTGVSLGLNTVKRLVGVIPDDVSPRKTTLNVIANYLGYPCWDVLQEDTAMEGSGFGKKDIFMEMSDLEEGVRVEVCWKPDRRILIRHRGFGQYLVLESENSKLHPGDLLTLSQLAIGFPFIADNVLRNEKPLGCYRAADGAGITRFKMIEDK